MKRKMSFTRYIKMEMPNQNAQAYAKDVKLTASEKKILVEYMNGYIAIQSLTAPMLAKMRVRCNHKYQFDRNYGLELAAINLSERDPQTLNKMFKESTLKSWLNEFCLISAEMQGVYMDEFGDSVFEGSNVPTVTGYVDTKPRARSARQVAEDQKNLSLLRAAGGAGGKTVIVTDGRPLPEDLSDIATMEEEEQTPDDKSVFEVLDINRYFTKHALNRCGHKLQNAFDEMVDYHNDSIHYLFKEFARSSLCAFMADFWASSFSFAYVEHKGDDNVLYATCRHFSVYISEKEVQFVDHWDLGDIAYTIPVSSEQPSRLEQAEYFFQTWDIHRLKKVMQHIGFGFEDELFAAGNQLNVQRVESGPQALMCMNLKDRPITWDGASFTLYSTLAHMVDGVRGLKINTDTNGDLSVEINGTGFDAVCVSGGASTGPFRYVLRKDDAKDFFTEYTDHMGFSDQADSLRDRGFVLDLNKERALLSFYNDNEKPCEIIAYC